MDQVIQAILSKLTTNQMFILLLMVCIIVIIALVVLLYFVKNLPEIMKEKSIKFEIK